MTFLAILVAIYVMYTNMQFLESNALAYIVSLFLLGYILYSKNLQKNKVFTDSLLLLLKFLIPFSLFIAIYGLTKNFTQFDKILMFNEYRKDQAFQTGLINFIISTITYMILLPTMNNTRRRIK